MHSHGIHSYTIHTHSHSVCWAHSAKRITFGVLHMWRRTENTVLFDLILLLLLLFGMKRQRQEIINKKHTHVHMYTEGDHPKLRHTHTQRDTHERAHALTHLYFEYIMFRCRSEGAQQRHREEWNGWEYCTNTRTHSPRFWVKITISKQSETERKQCVRSSLSLSLYRSLAAIVVVGFLLFCFALFFQNKSSLFPIADWYKFGSALCCYFCVNLNQVELRLLCAFVCVQRDRNCTNKWTNERVIKWMSRLTEANECAARA